MTSTETNGARLLADAVTFGPQTSDRAWARLGPGGPFRTTQPTPRLPNVNGWESVVSWELGTFGLAFPTTTNGSYVVQFKDTLNAAAWSSMPPLAGNGLEQIVTQEIGRERYYRVRRDP